MCSSLSSTSTWTRPSPPWHDVPGRELQATADALERSRDGLGKFSGVFRDVADAREGGWGASLARYHLGENVRRADQELAERIADAQAPFWGHVRDAVLACREEGG